jgi:DNA-binding HxlR family transcriptional regulator
MKRCYGRYCPVSHALDLVGERWALLIVSELMRGPHRYSDLAEALGVGTNILASRLRELEEAGVISKRRLPPPAASQVYELTEYGEQLKPVLHELAHWGARSLGPPSPEADLFPGGSRTRSASGSQHPPPRADSSSAWAMRWSRSPTARSSKAVWTIPTSSSGGSPPASFTCSWTATRPA